MKFFVFRVLTWLVFVSRIYYVWSRVYQFLFERKYKEYILPELDKLESISGVLRCMGWRPDKFRELWDAVSSPQATYARHCNAN